MPAERPASCLNCGSAAVRDFCPDCGQRNVELRAPAWTLAREALEDTFSFDSRLGRTAWPFLARPGYLTAEWCAGRRTRFSSPLRLYFLASAVFFLTVALVPGEGAGLRAGEVRVMGPGSGGEAGAEGVRPGGPEGRAAEAAREDEAAAVAREGAAPGGARREAARREGAVPEEAERGAASGVDAAPDAAAREAAHRGLRELGAAGRVLDERLSELERQGLPEAGRRISAAYREWVPRVMFFLVPVLALLLELLWRRRWLTEHLVFSLHAHAVAFVVLAAAAVAGERAGAAAVAALLAWLALALRRVYGDRWSRIALKLPLLALLYGVALGLGLAAVAAAAFLAA